MKYNIENAKKYLSNAIEIKSTSSGFFRELQSPVKRDIQKAKTDPKLSGEGRREKAQQLQEKAAIEILEKVHLRKQQYTSELSKARMIADKIINTPLKKPDAETLRRFEKSFKEFKTELMLTNKADKAQKKLNEFVSNINDPYIADLVRDDFHEIAESVISESGNESPKYKHLLSKTYESLKDDFEPQEVKEARQVLETSESFLEDPKIFSNRVKEDEPTLIETSATELLGHEFGRYVNDTDAFYKEYEGIKPDDYIDPDLEEERQIAEEEQKKADHIAMLDRTRKIMEEKLGGNA